MSNCQLFLSYLALCVLVNYSSSFHQSGYIVTAPSVLRSEVDHTISIRIFNHREAVRVNVKVVDIRENLIASISSEIIDAGSLKIKVPAGHSGKANIKVCGNCYLHTGFQFFNITPITIIDKGSSSFLQTDKPIYKPSQTVYINIFTISRDLKPANKHVTAYVTAPNGVRMMQWKNVTPTCCGVISISFPLSNQPLLGEWTVFAEVQKHSYNTTFEIQKYVLPKFDVIIYPPPFFRSACEEIVVESNYVFGKPVVGHVSVNMSVHGADYSKALYLDIGAPILRDMPINQQARFQVCLDQLLPEDLNPYFRGFLHIYATVTSQDGATFTAFDGSTPVSREKVKIQFTADTRENFKPGIPFKGKIKSTFVDGSKASHVTVHFSVEVDSENFFKQEIRSNSNGIVHFEVPALSSGSRMVRVKAHALAVRGEPITSHSKTIYINLYNWHSPSNCHLLAQGPSSTLQVDHQARVHVKSSCPCNFTLFYEILSRGNIVKIGSKVVDSGSSHIISSRRKRSPSSFEGHPVELPPDDGEVVDNEICQTSFVINVTSEMAPISRMLVYYVREDGEGVAESIRLPVELKLKNKVNVTTSPSETSPGKEVNLKVSSDEGSCVCLALVDRSVHIMRPGYMLDQDDIFDELESYDIDNSPYGKTEFQWRSSRSKRNTNLWWESSKSHDAKYAFLEAGLIVMTNVVGLNYKPRTRLYTDVMRQARSQALDRDATSAARRKRTFFPKTWIWSCFNVSSGVQNFTLTAPDTITTWQADAVSLNPTSGIGLAKPFRLQSFKRFFVEFNLPYSVVRGEEVQIPLTVYNYLNVCVEASLLVLLPPGISFRHRGSNRLQRRVCIHPQTTDVTQMTLRFGYLGKKSISASADAYVGSSACCDNSEEEEERIVESDFVTRNVLVEAEGVKREYTHSVYFCPNERINISTPSGLSFQFVSLPNDNTTGFDFLVKAGSNVHIVLSHEERVRSGSYHIVLGGSDNQRSWISRDSQHLVTAATSSILSQDAYKPFWITWTSGNIEVGTGTSQSSESRFMQWRGPRNTVASNISFVGFATSGDATGEFRLWQKQESEDSFTELFHLSLPGNTVPMSATGTASMIGDVMGPTLKNLNNLLSLPFGCGEQNLANFAPNVYVLKYLKGTRQLTEEVLTETTHYLQTGYQRQLTYKRSDGSYSAFGERDSTGSMWLTSFVLKSFSQARDFIFIDANEIHEAKEWIVSWQKRNGAFPSVGKIWNKDIQAGVDSDVALTAYVTIALLEAGIELEDEEIAVMKAQEFLELKVHGLTNSYTTSLTAYALTLLKSDFAIKAREQLESAAINQNGQTYWSMRDHLAPPDDSMMFGFADSMKQTVVSAEVEMTGYALLTYTNLQNRSNALPIVKWLSMKRNALGGFSSTQDTCVALQALSEYAILSFIGGINLNIVFASTNSDYDKKFELNNENDKVLQTATIPSLPTAMFVKASGVGCALLQIDVTYNIPNPETQEAFFITVGHHVVIDEVTSNENTQEEVTEPTSLPTAVKYEMKTCVRWLHHGSSNMAVLEFNLLTGFQPDLESIEELLNVQAINLKRYEVVDQKVLFYFDEIPSTCRTCIKFFATKTYVSAKILPRSVKIYDYYEPDYETEVMYAASASMMESANDTQQHSFAEEQANDCESSLLGCGDEYAECTCSHDCGFEGPPICGSNLVVYINRCRLSAASCELGIIIEERDDSFCQEESTIPIETDEFSPLNADSDDWEATPNEEGYQYFQGDTEEDDLFSSYQEVIVPLLRSPDNELPNA